jgi:uncharacterized protein (UPF0248 family)
MLNIRSDAPVAVTVIEAIHNGDVESLRRLLNENPGLATARLVDNDERAERTLLQVDASYSIHRFIQLREKPGAVLWRHRSRTAG